MKYMLKNHMESVRYFLALVLIYIMPIVITFWAIIHAFSDYWRRVRPIFAYTSAGVCIGIVSLFCFKYQDTLLGVNLGNNLFVFLIGMAIYILSWALWRPVKHYLDFKTFAGVPEVTDEKIDLIVDGPFKMVRHPRYLMVWIGVVGWCLMANYSGSYAVGIASMIGLFMIVGLEERDLKQRFGEQYTIYQENVPQLIPSVAGFTAFISENFAKRKAR